LLVEQRISALHQPALGNVVVDVDPVFVLASGRLTTEIARQSVVSLMKLTVLPAAIFFASRRKLPPSIRLRIMSISAAPGFTISGESRYTARYCRCKR
jgi:hypothetical protein